MLERFVLPRRRALQFGVGGILGSAAFAAPPALAQSDITDEDIFQFAMNLEYMETEYYLRGTTGKGISGEDAGSDAGEVTGGHEVKFKSEAIRQSARNWPKTSSRMY